MIAINVNHSLDEIPDNCYIKILDHNAEDIALEIENLLSNKINLLEIKRNSEIFAKNVLLSWEQRVKIEREIIYDRINNQNVNQC
ncbi:MAG: hypothetical protein MZV64_15640 [Ignavibacteriales bacterium]|nr:hypothetical protein [Ignavibacteriales bacterium]